MPTLPVARCSACRREAAVRRGRCASCDARSPRNHYGIPKRERQHGAGYDALQRLFRGQPCEMLLPGCTGTATGADLIVPQSRGGLAVRSNARPGCAHCQSVQGGRMTRRASR